MISARAKDRVLFAGLVALLGVGLVTGNTHTVGAQDEDPEATIAALQTQVAELQQPGAASPTPEALVDSDGASDASSLAPVNLELILDVSGSMAQTIPTGESRMEAAKRVMQDVIAGIPDREGINVGLRVYGHEGNNTQAGAEVSCGSSELIVPLSGVDKDAIGREINQLQPTGWTPIGLSLERAGEDFTAAGNASLNYIVLVTDGLETCGGDPVQVARALRQGDSAITTSVVGFGLTPEEQATIAQIAQEGGGDVLGAADAAELSDALFTVLSTPVPDIETPTPSSGAVPLNDTFELLDYYFAEDQFYLYVFGEIRNFSDQPAAVPPVVFTFLDEAGNSYGEEVVWPDAGWVPAGGRVPFQQLNILGSNLRPGDWAEVSVTAGTPRLIPEGFNPSGIELQDIPLEGPVAPLRGTIKNNYPDSIGPILVKIAYYDNKDRFVGSCDGKYLDLTIPPGRSVRLEMSNGGCSFHDIAKAALGATGPFTYRLFV